MIICVVGPTGSGKSKLATKTADFYNAKIVNFDAFQVYKEMDIGTAKPTKEELNSGNYFLYDFVNITEDFDVSKYQKICRKFLEENSDKNIVLVGGTGLYLKATLFDYNFKEEDPMPTNYLENISNDELYKRLHTIDAIDAEKIGVNNRKRLLRALFIYETHGVSKTELNQNGRSKLLYENVHFIGLNYDREKLYEMINNRVDKMFSEGLADEVTYLFNRYGTEYRSLQAIGYKEFTEAEDFDEVKELIKQHTRNYAKRQLTFFKHQFENIEWFDSIDGAFEYAKENIK